MKQGLAWLQRYGFWMALLVGISIYVYTQWPHQIAMNDIVIYDKTYQKTLPLKTETDSTTIVHFYAHWCGPCMKELPDLMAIKKTLNQNGCRLVLITDDPLTIKMQFEQKFKTPIEGTPSLKSLNVFSIPMTYFYDRQGNIISREEGMCAWDVDFIDNKLKQMNHE
jgi:thiol-disulfide isomerase/thioredoxin